MKNLKALERLEESFAKLPSVGKKSAERMAYSVLEMDDFDIQEFSNALKDLKSKIHFCPICGSLTEDEVCDICSDKERDQSTIMVVSYPKDIFAFEKANDYKGVYHVLGGAISVSKGIGVEDLRIKELLERINNGNVKEVIIATNPTIEGETTALYLAKLLAKQNINTSRIAYGLPMGASLDYTDSLTLNRAIEGRTKL